MNVGFFTKQKDYSFTGDLPTMHLRGVSLEPVKKVGKGPDYRASVEGAELGAAWVMTSKNGNDYISLKVIVPGREAVRLAILPTKVEGQFVAAYSEPKVNRVEAADSAEA